MRVSTKKRSGNVINRDANRLASNETLGFGSLGIRSGFRSFRCSPFLGLGWPLTLGGQLFLWDAHQGGGEFLEAFEGG